MNRTILQRCWLLAVGILLPLSMSWAQGIGGISIGHRLKNEARLRVNRAIEEGKDAVREGVNEKKQEIKREVRATKEGIKDGKYMSVPRANGNTTMEEVPATMDALIEDPLAKDAIEDRNNKKRFVSLFGQWWSLPNEAEFNAQKYLDSLRRARAAIDSSKYRTPKMVTKYQPVTVWGWHFAGQDNNNFKSYNYGILNTIAYSSYDINVLDGTPLEPEKLGAFRSGEFTKTVRQDTLKPVVIFLTLSCHSAENIAYFLDRNPAAYQTMVDTVLMLLDAADANGVEVNFENIPIEYKDNFVKFVKKLTSDLRKANPDYAVCVSVPSRDPNNIYDISQMRSFVDFFVIRAFDFHKKAKKDPYLPDEFVEGPASPMNYNVASPDYDLRACIEHYIGQIGVLNANRLILGLPYFGTMWERQGTNVRYVGDLSYQEILFEFVSKEKGVMDTFTDKTAFRWMFVDSTLRPPLIQTIYYDDIPSLRAKYRELMSYRLGGVALYQLGYDQGFDQLWGLLAEEFTYVDIPPDARLAKAEQASKRARRYGTITLGVIFYLTIFMSIGFFKALLDRDVRQRLFSNGRFRLWYLGFFTLFLLILGGYLGLFEGKTSALVMGLLIGSALAWFILKRIAAQQAKQP